MAGATPLRAKRVRAVSLGGMIAMWTQRRAVVSEPAVALGTADVAVYMRSLKAVMDKIKMVSRIEQ